jgi:hypothetical protein
MHRSRTTTVAALAAAFSMTALAAGCRQPGPPGGTTTSRPPSPTTAPTTKPAPTTAPTTKPSTGTPKFSSSGQWAEWNDGGYTLRNDIWGSGAGPQTIWANSYRDWGVRANHPDTGGVKAYPHVARMVNRKASSLSSLRSNFAVTVPSSGAYTTAYDIWCDDHTYEIMIWMNKVGPVGPIGAQEATASLGGHSFAVHKGSNGANQVYSFVRQSNTNSGTVDIKAIVDWIRARGWFGDVTVGDVQFGYEITSSAGNLAFTTTDYSVSFS